MDRPVMPTWRERGAHPRSVTFRVAASSAPRMAASGLSCSYSSGRHAGPHADHHLSPGQRLDVVVAALGQHPDPAPRADAARVAHARLVVLERRRRQHARAGPWPSGWRWWHVMSATSAPAKAGLAATSAPSRADERDGVAHEPRARRGRGAAGHLAAEGRARGEQRPTAPSRAHVVGDRIGHVLGDG